MPGDEQTVETGEGGDLTEATVDASSVGRSARTRPHGLSVDIGRGEFIDRYVVLDELGAGGMGVVFKALDPELERRVAIKVLRPRPGSANTEGRARLVREGQAIAQLAHPNVVAVYDIGIFGEGLFFVAMEYVEGQSLRDWLREQERSRDEIIEVFIQAGRGLAAAHDKDLIHRDFKPDNVLVGDDGRVRVLDFGLARYQNDTGLESELKEAATTGPRRVSTGGLSDSLTRTGDIMGTPAFMAPEQHRGEVGDARIDQFAFFVALYQALCGQRPFKGATVAAAEEGKQQPARPLPAASQVPGWLERLIIQGLALKAEDRHASMAIVLAELGRDRGKVRRRALAAAVLVSCIIGVAAVTSAVTQQPEKCSGAQSLFEQVWSPDRRAEVERSFLATERPYAFATFRRVDRWFADYGQAWTSMYTESCEATQMRGVQSVRLLDLRTACLERRLSELGALAVVFATELDPGQLDKAVQAAYGLTPVATCADREALESVVPPPSDSVVRQRVMVLRSTLDQSAALQSTGKYPEGLAIVETAAREAEGIDYAPLQAEVYYRLGALQQRNGSPDDAEQSLYRALMEASVGRDQALVVRVQTELVWVVGYLLARYDAGYAFYRTAAAAAKATELDTIARVQLLKSVGVVYFVQGKYDEAQHYYVQGLKLFEQEFGTEHPGMATALNNLGSVAAAKGRTDEAIDYFERALEIGEQTLGTEHPYVTDYVTNLGAMYADRDEFEEALVYYDRALASLEKTLGPEHPDVAYPVFNMANSYASLGRHDEAVTAYERAIAIRERAFGPSHPFVALPLAGLGIEYLDSGQLDKAIVCLERALGILEGADGDPDPLAETQFALARALWDSGGDRARALRMAKQAHTFWASSEGRWDADRKAAAQWLGQLGHAPAAAVPK